VLLVVEMAHEEPDIRFDTISDSSGMETTEKERSHARRIYCLAEAKMGIRWYGLTAAE
jgi:hypothetical protein